MPKYNVKKINHKTTSRIISDAIEFHNESVKAGWWTDLKTGENTETTRNRFELLALVVTELSEAHQGCFSENHKDDKLPHYPMYDVELADAIIRLSDILGAEIAVGHVIEADLEPYTYIDSTDDLSLPSFSINKRDINLMLLVNTVSTIIECYRKNKYQQAGRFIINAIIQMKVVHMLSGFSKTPIDEIISEKRLFNAKREDHKIENRKKDGGKAH